MRKDPEADGALTGTPPVDAAELWRQLRASARQAGVWLALAADYRHHALPWQAAHAARQALRCDATVWPQLDALDLGPWQDVAAGDAQLGRPTLPQASALVEQFSARTRACPGDWLTWLYLARLHEQQALVTQEPKPVAALAAHAEALARKTYQEIVQSRLAASEPGTVARTKGGQYGTSCAAQEFPERFIRLWRSLQCRQERIAIAQRNTFPPRDEALGGIKGALHHERRNVVPVRAAARSIMALTPGLAGRLIRVDVWIGQMASLAEGHSFRLTLEADVNLAYAEKKLSSRVRSMPRKSFPFGHCRCGREDGDAKGGTAHGGLSLVLDDQSGSLPMLARVAAASGARSKR